MKTIYQKELTEDVESDASSDSDTSTESDDLNLNETAEDSKPKKKPKS